MNKFKSVLYIVPLVLMLGGLIDFVEATQVKEYTFGIISFIAGLLIIGALKKFGPKN